ncbi:putative basal body-orientation factor 1 [Plasmopara halstedii]
MEAGEAVIDNGATALFNQQFNYQKLEAMAARVSQLQNEDAELRARNDKRERETHEFVAYFQKEILTRDTQIAKLSEELAATRLSHALALEQMRVARDTEHEQLVQQTLAKEDSALNEITELREKLDQLKLFQEMKDTFVSKIKDLETQLTFEREQAREALGALERKSLEEKARMQKDHERKIDSVKRQAKEDARNGLNADTRKIVTDHKRICEELRFQLQMTDELHREKQQFEARAKDLNMELQIHVDKETEFAKQAQRQARELTRLRSSLREAEQKLGDGLAAASWDAHANVTRYEREREDMLLDVEGLRKLLRLKNRELRNLRRLAQTILNQRTDVEQFCLDSLEHVKNEIERERKKKHKREVEKYHYDLECANGTKPSLRFPKLISPTSYQNSGPPQHFTEKVDLRQLSWIDRERVLRLLFAKINRSQGFIDIQGDTPSEIFETSVKSSPSPNQKEKQRSTNVYFATEPQTRHKGRATTDENSVGEDALSMSLSGMPYVPRAPTRIHQGG